MIDFDAIEEKENEVRRKWKAWQSLRERATDTSVHLSDMPRGGGDGKAQEKAIVEMTDVESSYLQAMAELSDMRKELEMAMGCLTKWQHRDVITKRYLEGKTVTQTMMEIGYEWSQTQRFLNEARRAINGAKME